MKINGNKSGKYSQTALFGGLVRYYVINRGNTLISNQVYRRLESRYHENHPARPVMVDVKHTDGNLYHISRFEPVRDNKGVIEYFNLYTSETVDGKGPAYWSLFAQGDLELKGYTNTVVTTPSGDPMHYMYEVAGAVWNEETRLWTLNDVDDMTTEEIRESYAVSGVGRVYSKGQIVGMFYNIPHSKSIRALFPVKISGLIQTDFSTFCRDMDVTTIVLKSTWNGNQVYAETLYKAFLYCPNLRTIDGVFIIPAGNNTYNYTLMFEHCPNVENFKIRNIRGHFDISYLEKVSTETILYLIENVNKTSTGVVVTLHSQVYNRALADDQIVAALAAHTNITLADAGGSGGVLRIAHVADEPIVADDIRITEGEIMAPAGRLITQTAEVADTERLFFARKTWNINDDLMLWRVATAEERDEWRRRMDQTLELQ